MNQFFKFNMEYGGICMFFLLKLTPIPKECCRYLSQDDNCLLYR